MQKQLSISTKMNVRPRVNLQIICNIIKQNCRKYSKSFSENLFTQDNGITVFNLCRPQQKNSLSIQLVRQINKVIDDISADPHVRVLIIRSLVPGVFCAGADLKERATFSPQQVSDFVQKLRNLMSRVENLEVPVIAAIDGLALGGGLELALASDLRVASATSKMGLVETKLAIIPGAGGSQRLPRLINPAVAKELIYTGRIFDAIEAKNLGIVNHVVEQNENGDAAFIKSLDIARQILPNGPVAVKMAKIAINRGLNATDINDALEIEKDCYDRLIPTEDRIEGLAAFKDKRTPKYSGR